MDSRDLRNLAEAWESITTPETETEQLDEQGRMTGPQRRARQAQQQSAAAQSRQQSGEALRSFVNRGGLIGAFGRALEARRQEVAGRRQLKQDEAESRAQARRLGDAPARETGMSRPATPAVAAKPDTAPAPQTVAASGGAGGRVTVGKKYAATLGGKQGTVTYDASGKKTFTANAPTKPVASDTKPVTPAGSAVADAKPATPVKRPSILSDLDDLKRMRAASLMRQQGRTLPGGKIPVGSDLKKLNQDLDLFDIVKGYLLDEGATEEEALKRMAVMTEEERNEIIESSCGSDRPMKKKKKKSGY